MALTTKALMDEAMRSLPEDATLEQAFERLLFLSKIEKGLEDADAGRISSTKAVRKHLRP
jgi:predicted transcriptional regulator